LKLATLSEGTYCFLPSDGKPSNDILRTARGRKIPLLKSAFEKYPKFEVVEIADVAASDFSAAFKGVGAIIHTAAPLPGRTDAETALKSAIEGSLHILRDAHKAGIKKVVVTGSMITFPEGAYGPNGRYPD
jgi:nucleoside-diphosphate-sugar epimerase